MATSTTKILTPARQAVWASLKAWQPLCARVQTFYESDDEYHYLLQQAPQLSRLPAVSVMWQEFRPEWWVNTQQEWLSPLRVSVWVPDSQLSLAESLVEDAIDAVYRAEHSSSTAAGPMSLIRYLTGCDVHQLGPLSIVPVSVGDEGQHRLLEASFVIGLRLQKNPQLRATA